MKNQNAIKEAVTRFRRESKKSDFHKVPLFHILINVRSNFGYSWQTSNMALLGLIASLKNQHREYGIKRAVIERYGASCFKQFYFRNRYGKRTVFENGQWKSDYTEAEKLPF